MTTTRTITVFLAATLLLAGCTNDPGPAPTITDPRGTSTATQTTEPAPVDPQQAADLAAIQAYKDFNVVYNEVAQAGYQDWAKVQDLTTSPYWTEVMHDMERWAQAGARQTGETKLSDFKVVEHRPGRSTINNVVLEVCADSSDIDVVNPDGTSRLIPGTTGRFVSTVYMWTFTGDGWAVAERTVDRRRPC